MLYHRFGGNAANAWLVQKSERWLVVLPENGLHLKAELPRPFSYLLHGFKTTPESFFSCWVKSTFALSRVNPAKLIAVLAAVARAARLRTCDCFGVRSIWWVTNYRLRTKPDQLIGNAKAHHSAQTG